jgi:hypothetical protein
MDGTGSELYQLAVFAVETSDSATAELLNVVVKWLALLLRIREVLGYLGLETGYPD